MSKQSHDPGVRKQKKAEARKYRERTADSPEALARRLVERGLCSPQILTGSRRT